MVGNRIPNPENVVRFHGAPLMRREFEQHYPTQKARQAADAATDALDISVPMQEYIRVWELVYLANGGIIRLSRKR